MERIEISGPNPVLLKDMQDPVKVAAISLRAELYRPDGEGPFPGVVISEGLGGLKDSRERGYGRKLAAAGYLVVVVDSFTSRGVGENGDLIRALSVTEAMMLADAFSAARYLAGRPDVDAARIGVIGFSYGGMIAVLTSYEQVARAFLPDGLRFASHVSYYGCSIPRLEHPVTTGAPVHLLAGSRDRNVSVGRSEAIVEDLRRGGSAAALSVFDGVYHQWDGDDERRRFVPFNLRRLHMRVGRDDEVRDERTGLRMAGRRSRTAVIGLWTDPTGYMILRDEETTRRTDDILLGALGAM